MARSSWQNLSLAYRKRLERGGITKHDYESGVSLTKARGHKTSQDMVQIIFEYKKQWFGHRPRWNEGRARQSIEINPATGKKRSQKDLRRILRKIAGWIEIYPEPDWDIIAGDDEESAFYYH